MSQVALDGSSGVDTEMQRGVMTDREDGQVWGVMGILDLIFVEAIEQMGLMLWVGRAFLVSSSDILAGVGLFFLGPALQYLFFWLHCWGLCDRCAHS